MRSVEAGSIDPKGGRAHGKWFETTQGVIYVVDDSVQFCDDFDHWKNAFCRLLEISDEKARAYIEETAGFAQEHFGRQLQSLSDDQKIACVAEATTRMLYGGARPSAKKIESSWGTDLWGAPPDTVFAHSVSGHTERFVVGSKQRQFAWLIDADTGKPVRADSIKYDDAYFGSGGNAHYGMKHYVSQSDWRLEKARRLVRTVLENSGARKQHFLDHPPTTNVLDVGSGLGYFRKAFDELGYRHYGVDLSKYINLRCKQMFGFESWNCDFTKLNEVAGGMKFDIITMWELIEHVEDAAASVRLMTEFLAPGGILVARTPNLSALEYDILGDYYYSFKFEHVKYFSPQSYDYIMTAAGLQKIYMETSSHIFKGILGPDYLYKAGQQLRGADIVAIYGN